MGAESYQTTLGNGRCSFGEAEAAVRALPGCRPDPDGGFMPDCHCYTASNGFHVFELEVSSRPVSVSCRFAMCHPQSADEAYLQLLKGLMEQLGLEAWSPAEGGPDRFPVGRFDEFAELARPAIRQWRDYWVADFGPEQRPATSRQAYEWFIRPKCLPPAGGDESRPPDVPNATG